MPVLDAKALKADPEGLAFLRDVLRSAGKGAEKPVSPLASLSRPLSRPRRETVKASVLAGETPRTP